MTKRTRYVGVTTLGFMVAMTMGMISGAVVAVEKGAVMTPKRRIEQPLERLVAEKTTGKVAERFHNPKVAPGKVQWHPDMQTACAASRKSGKPVLLFQMMGKLDDQFC